MKNRVLFVTEKFCDGTPKLNLTNNFQNLFNTFSQAYGDKYNWNTLHIDESSLVFGQHIDQILLKYCLHWDINIIIYSLLGQSPWNPSLRTFAQLKDMGVYQCFMWPDTGPGWGTETIRTIGDLGNLHVSWDNPYSDYHNSLVNASNHVNLWVPQDNSLFYPDKQDIEVSFIGSPRYQDRQFFISQLQQNDIPLTVKGGQREEKLSPYSYAEYIRRSKIGLNFSLSPAQFFQTKGRVFEILASQSMLLEFKNAATAKLFEPNKDFIEFSDTKDAIDKIKYYLSHEEERIKIAEQGWKTYTEKYSSKCFWDNIISRIETHFKNE